MLSFDLKILKKELASFLFFYQFNIEQREKYYHVIRGKSKNFDTTA